MATTAGVILLLVLSLVSLSIALPAGTCGTAHPIRPASGVGKAIPTCGRHECDDPAIRDQYLLNAASPMITINLNVVYFGVLAGSNLTRYNAQLAFFQREYGRHMNVTWSIHTTVVEDRYQVVNGSDRVLHAQIAKEFYIAGSPTVLWTTFNPNPDNLLGYAYYPQSLDFETAPELWYGIMDIKNALTPQGTTMLHEVGHMLGLFHTFTESCNPDRCPENINSPDLNIVGDFCSDTKPVWMSFDCDVLSTQDYDCNNVKYTTDLSLLPQDNYMAYTPDSCQDQFTPQQAARVRCYLDRLISFATVTPPGTSTSPTASGTVPIKSPTKAPTTKAISVASRADVVAVLVGLVFVIVSL